MTFMRWQKETISRNLLPEGLKTYLQVCLEAPPLAPHPLRSRVNQHSLYTGLLRNVDSCVGFAGNGLPASLWLLWKYHKLCNKNDKSSI